VIRQVLIPLVGGMAGFYYFTSVRDYPFRLALVMGIAALMLTWAALRTWDRLRGMFGD
jgi:hypothetical protein